MKTLLTVTLATARHAKGPLMASDAVLEDLAHTIQLAVAPVFLLTALGTILSVLSARLGRIVDRARALTALSAQADPDGARAFELKGLAQRRRLINSAITFATLAALLVCVLIALAFIAFMLNRNFSFVIATLFIAAMSAFVAALGFFLSEVLVAVKSTPMQ